MRALRAHHRGGPEQLTVEDVEIPVPGPGEALVAVHAAAITLTELGWDLSWQTREGADRTPVIPAHEVSGVVAAVGPGVQRPVTGDAVFGLIDFDRNGAAADFVTVPAAALAVKPAGITHVEAASLSLSALTAWQALVDHAHVQPGETVLVHGAAGGVGGYAVQLAVHLGARVIATDRPENESFVRSLGASEFVDITTQRFDEELSGLDVVVDAVGGETLTRSYEILHPGGRLVTLAAPVDAARAKKHDVQATFFVVRPDAGELARIAVLVEAGILKPAVAATFSLSDGRAAFESSNTPRRPGKVVLIVGAQVTPHL